MQRYVRNRQGTSTAFDLASPAPTEVLRINPQTLGDVALVVLLSIVGPAGCSNTPPNMTARYADAADRMQRDCQSRPMMAASLELSGRLHDWKEWCTYRPGLSFVAANQCNTSCISCGIKSC